MIALILLALNRSARVRVIKVATRATAESIARQITKAFPWNEAHTT